MRIHLKFRDFYQDYYVGYDDRKIFYYMTMRMVMGQKFVLSKFRGWDKNLYLAYYLVPRF